jgi:hypothetical protein
MQEELAASQRALDGALAEARQQRQLLQQREGEAVDLAKAVEAARAQTAQVCVVLDLVLRLKLFCLSVVPENSHYTELAHGMTRLPTVSSTLCLQCQWLRSMHHPRLEMSCQSPACSTGEGG